MIVAQLILKVKWFSQFYLTLPARVAYLSFITWSCIISTLTASEEEKQVAEQATVEPEDIEAIIALLKDKNGPLPLDILVERYVARLKERITKETESAPASA
jgi:hypothetical protein